MKEEEEEEEKRQQSTRTRYREVMRTTFYLYLTLL